MPKFKKNTSPAMYKKSSPAMYKKGSPIHNYNNFSSYNVKAGGSKNSPEGFSMRGFSGFGEGTSPVKFDWKYFLAGPAGRKRLDAEFENKIRMEENWPRRLPEVNVVGKKSTPPKEKKTTEQPKKWTTKFTKP